MKAVNTHAKTKLCEKCELVKGITQFKKHASFNSGYSKICRECEKDYIAKPQQKIKRKRKEKIEINDKVEFSGLEKFNFPVTGYVKKMYENSVLVFVTGSHESDDIALAEMRFMYVVSKKNLKKVES